MAKKTTTRKRTLQSKRNVFDPISLASSVQMTEGLGKYLPKQSQVDRFVRGSANPGSYTSRVFIGPIYDNAKSIGKHLEYRGIISVIGPEFHDGKSVWVVYVKPSEAARAKHIIDLDRPTRSNPEDIALLNDLAPSTSLGHIEFTDDGIERYVRDGYVYRAFSQYPVMEDGYRVGAVEDVATVGYANPRRCINPAPGSYLGNDGYFEYWQWGDNIYRNVIGQRGYMIDPVTSIALPEGETGGIPSGARWEAPIHLLKLLQPRFVKENPAKFDRCVREVSRRSPDVNAYAVCTASGARNPDSMRKHRYQGFIIVEDGGYFEPFYAKDYPYGYPIGSATTLSTAKQMIRERNKEDRKISGSHSRRRRNPADSSDELYTDFHGTPPTETLEIKESFHVHEHLGGLGDLVEIKVRLMGGSKAGALATITAPDPNKSSDEDVVHVAGNEARNQMYLVGGDQSINLKALGYRDSFTVTHDGEEFESTEIKDLMMLGEIEKLTYQTEKKFDGFKTIDYFHELGEDTKVRPFLTYDTLSKHMGIYGGEYTIHSVGVVN